MARKRTRRDRLVRARPGRAAVKQRPPTPQPGRTPKPDETTSDRAQDTHAAMIVGVGASAGGLDAFSQILDGLPPKPNVAFIFVQHLSPQHESALPALLSAKTQLPVVQAASGMKIEPNQVYVMPPNVQMEIADDALHLLPRPHDRTQFTPIDVFLESLAHWAQERAIAIILSGTASDGAVGIREIKAMGGITIAQQPDSAKYDGMPRAAIATGLIDLILTPQEIAEHISHVRRHPYLVQEPEGETRDRLSPSDEQFRDIFALLRRACGIDFKQYKAPTVKRRLLRRMALHRLTDVDAYVRYLREHSPEVTALCQDLLIHVTRFFREPDSFKALTAHVLSEIVHERSDDAIRVWVPGCATGEEAYSLAIVLLEALGDRSADRKIQVFATDVSEGAIEHARAATYPPTISADVSPERLRRFFAKSDGGYRVSKMLRDMCVFARHDLARDPPFSRLDLIVCRNVLIYLDAELQKRVMSIFHYALKPQGFLMLGPAETTGPQASFTVIDKKWRLYKKTPGREGVALAFPSERPAGVRTGLASAPGGVAPRGAPLQEQATRIVLDKYSPPGVVVDANLQIVQFRGRTGPYLEAAAGDPNLNVLKMARGGLLHPLRTALQTARRKRRTVRKERVMLQRNGDWHVINLAVVPLTAARGEYFLVLFETPPAKPSRVKARRATRSGERRAVQGELEERVSDLRRELAANRDYLQSIIQELEAANEELQAANEENLSSNEELQSTNEELDTAKEELQSANEELNTVNEELHSRNEELARANADLVNLLASVDFPVVIVGEDLAIRRFTPMAEQAFNLIPGDVGRPIGQIKPNIQCDNLEALIRETIDGIAPREREVQDRQGRWYSLRIRPYKGLDNRLDGAVVAAIDVDVARRHQRHVERSRDYFMTIVETVRQPLLVLDDDLRVRTANRSFYERFEASPADTEGVPIVELGRQWDLPALHEMLDAVVAGRPAVDLTVEHHFKSIGRKKMLINARRLELDDDKHWILVAIGEMTDVPAQA